MRSRCRALNASADDLQRKQTRSTALQESLGQVDELAKRTAWQYENLKQSRQDLDPLRKEIQDFYKSHADGRAAARSARRPTARSLEAFLERTTAFSAELPDSTRGWTRSPSKLAIVDEGTQKAANLVSIADDLDRQMNRIASQQQFVERVEARLNSLNVLTGEVDRKLDEQIARRGEVEALRSQIDGVAIEVTDARQKLEGVSAMQKQLLPLTAQLSMLKSQIEKVHARFVAAQQEEATLAEQEQRLAEMLAPSRDAYRGGGRALRARCRAWPRKSVGRR